MLNVGVVLNYNFGVQWSRATRYREELTELLAQYARLVNPNLTIRIIQVCRVAHPILHVDPRNVGRSVLVVFGDCVGGKFRMCDDARRNVEMAAADPIRNRPEISVVNVINGNLYDTKGERCDVRRGKSTLHSTNCRYQMSYHLIYSFSLSRSSQAPTLHIC